MESARKNPDKARVLCLSLVIGCAGLLDVFVAGSMTTTYDEPQSVAYGEQILHRRADRYDPLFNSKAPITALNALPRVLAGCPNHERIPPFLSRIVCSIRFARWASVVATLILNFFVYRWASALYGTSAAIAISILVVLSPNLIAHGTLANNDGYFALGVVMSLFFFRSYLLHPTFRTACLSALTLAIAQLTKAFAIYLYAVVLIVILIASSHPGNRPALVRRREAIVFATIAFVFFVLILNVGFWFDRSFTPLKSYHFDSRPLIRLQKTPVLRSLPVPVPYAYLQGLDMLEYHDDTGLTYGKIYLLGELRDPFDPSFRNFKSYYAVALFFKEPIAVQILFLLGLVWIWKNRNYRDFITGEAVLLSAAFVLFLWFSLLRKSQLGIRNILPVIAIEIIVAGAAFATFTTESRGKKITLGLAVLWGCVSMMSYYPDLIPYMNEWVIDRKQSYRILVDSNLDFGQEGDLVHRFLQRNPDVVLDPETPTSGRVLVSVNRLVGEWHGYDPMYWLLRYQPIASVGYGHLLFVVPAHDIASVRK